MRTAAHRRVPIPRLRRVKGAVVRTIIGEGAERLNGRARGDERFAQNRLAGGRVLIGVPLLPEGWGLRGIGFRLPNHVNDLDKHLTKSNVHFGG